MVHFVYRHFTSQKETEGMNEAHPKIQPKQHFEILDGLRGVAAMMVVIFHTFEAWNGGGKDSAIRQVINHGYMAVDFFFMLSGFVVAYAYDDRWGKMSVTDFFKRRLIRLQPMVIMGTIIGALLFYPGASAHLFPKIATVPLWQVILTALIGFTLIPLPMSMDIRGWGEMHPLDGPAWSLFFEYIANIAYALGLRKASNRVLGILTALAGVFLVHLLLTGTRGDVIGGWSINALELHVGFARLLFPFMAGMLLMRLHKRIHVKNAFLWCSLLLIVSFSLPRFGDLTTLWKNGLYEAIVILFLFPVIVAMGAGDQISGKTATKLCKFSGEISYPLYITHYPLIYIYTAWVYEKKLTVQQGYVYGAVLFILAVAIAYACLKLYDEPVRRWLNRRFLVRGVTST